MWQLIFMCLQQAVEKKGKDGQYAYGVFKLYTATKAYADLANAAGKADSESGGEANTKVLAMEKKSVLKQKLIDDFQGMLKDFDSYPIDEMIEKHKIKLGEAAVAPGL